MEKKQCGARKKIWHLLGISNSEDGGRRKSLMMHGKDSLFFG